MLSCCFQKVTEFVKLQKNMCFPKSSQEKKHGTFPHRISDLKRYQTGSRICSSRPGSLNSSFIDYIFIFVCIFNGKRQKHPVFYKVHFSCNPILYCQHHPRMIQQTDLRLLLVIHQQVYIAVRPLFAAGIGAEKPGADDRLRGI